MAFNYPGPFGLRLFYTTAFGGVTLDHKAEYNIALLDSTPTPGTAFADMDVVLKDGTNTPLSTYADAWADLFKACLNNGAGNGITHYELWQYAPLSFDATFISTYSSVDAGSNASAVQSAAQSIITYRTIGGGVMKLVFLETPVIPAARDPAPFTFAPFNDINTFILGPTNGFLGRDTTYPFAAIAHFPGQNEALFKRRYR